ncbi:hypothetical protein [Kitasatospora mediocidica]|uniref:hypothetical protein n=1 Tax=Kitasatospora mediocidica TaxID=58352 RepID=UPI000690C3E6|nr:hypothetical protein [Kitasatospora mediocidica]
MTRTMYDSVSVSSLPADATMVAGYADGLYANLTAMRARFPHATVVSIAVRYTTRAQVLDVETGDATPAQAVVWCRQTMADTPNSQLTVYCNTSTWPAVRAALAAAGESPPQYWVAQYDGVASIPGGAIAKQYRTTPGWDASIVADYWPGVDAAPTPAPPSPPPVPPEDIVTPEDIAAVAAAAATAVWNHTEPDPLSGGTARMGTVQAWRDQVAQNKTSELERQIAASTAAITALVNQLGAQHGTVDTAAVVAAVQAAIAAAVVHVDVNVTGPTAA